MTTLTFGRIAAVVLSIGTFAFLFGNDSWRGDNPFLVPDLLLCALLLIAAALPAGAARSALVFASGLAAGVFATSVANYAVDGQLGGASLFGAVSAAVVGIVVARSTEDRSRLSGTAASRKAVVSSP